MNTQKLPTFRVKSSEPIGVELFFALPDLQEYEKSFFETDSAIGATTLNANGLMYAADDYLLLGQPGLDKAEIVKVTSVSATTIVCSATVYAHNRGDSITFIPYNQIIVESSALGVIFVPQIAFAIYPSMKETYKQYPSDTNAYSYKFRFFNSTTSKYSAYSETLTGIGYADNTVHSVKKRALSSLGEKINDLITDDFLNESIREARRAVDMDPRIIRWSFRTKYNVPLSPMIPGQYKVALPTDLRDIYSNKNILGLRVGKQSYTVVYQDNLRFRQNYYNIPHTTVKLPVLAGATTITLTNSGDLQESGAIVVSSGAVNTQYSIINYTSNNEVTGVISGVTGVPLGGFAAGLDVWQNATFGVPGAYTVENGYILFDLPFQNDSDGENIYIDYYTSLVEINNDAQTFDEPFYDLYVSYLRYKIKYKKANGSIDRNADSDYVDWTENTTRLISQELMGQNIRFVPSITGLFLR